MPDTTRAFDFSPLPRVLCINTSNVNDFKPLAFRREDPGLQKVPSNSPAVPCGFSPARCTEQCPRQPQHPDDPTAGGLAPIPTDGRRGSANESPLG